MKKERLKIKYQSGQVILLLLLAITVGLGVGLSIVQRSISNLSTSTKVEESQRAFSAAEAGIERALLGDYSGADFTGENLSKSIIETAGDIPGLRQTLEYPKLAKEEISQLWLANPLDLSPFYTQNNLEVYWGTPGITDINERPAISLRVIYLSGANYLVKPFFFDPVESRRVLNGFLSPDSCSDSLPAISTTFGENRSFYCKATLSGLSPTLVAVRARILYSGSSHPIAFVPTGGCEIGCSFPPQAKIITSVGTSGATQRKLQLFVMDKIVPPYFDYAVFSIGEITK